ncbi:PspC domain-containing protein [Limosilactobacillus difficilis]|uniref:PspC domain-containing protein n=1 Tax=Limosilactobacillus difficilis TaxID=2991838 RepID=UPI0024B8C4F4|nr:PspC domain-containing protein [Limosilactobacillus difficilis]
MRRREDREKLTRSATDRYVAGVFGGLAAYFGVKANLLRVLFLIIMLITGIVPCTILYFISALLMPPDANDTSITGVLANLLRQGKNDEAQQSQRKELHDVEEHDINKGQRS